MIPIVSLILTYRYWILIPLTFLEGPIVAFIAGTLAAAGYFNPYILFVVFFVRDLTVDGACYALGRYAWKTAFVKRFLTRVGVTDMEINDIRPLWLKHPGSTMFFSKLSYGIAAGLMVVAGIIEMPFLSFLMWGSLIAVAHYGTLLVLGYYFGGTFGTVSNLLTKVSYIAIGIVAVAVAYYFFKRSMRKRLLEAELKEEALSK